MAAVKKLNTTYTLDTSEVIITGNLTVQGVQTSLETTNSTLKDNIIVLNDGEAGAGVTLGTSGILIDRGSSTDVALRWTEANGGSWQVTSDGTNYANIATSVSSGITAVGELLLRRQHSSSTCRCLLQRTHHRIPPSHVALDGIALASHPFVTANTTG